MIATQVEPETRIDELAERALSASCVLVECGRVTFQFCAGLERKSYVSVASWLRAEELHANCKLFACGKVACCLRLGCAQEICKLRAHGRAACYSRVGYVRAGDPRKLRVGCVLVACWLSAGKMPSGCALTA